MNTPYTAAFGRKVVAADSAEDVGKVKAFVVDQPPRRITALHVTGRKGSAELVDWTSISGFGPDAVMISSASALRQAEADREDEIARHKVEILGARVVDTGGFERGTVDDVQFDSDSGQLIGLNAGGVDIPITACRSVGSYAVVVDGPGSA